MYFALSKILILMVPIGILVSTSVTANTCICTSPAKEAITTTVYAKPSVTPQSTTKSLVQPTITPKPTTETPAQTTITPKQTTKSPAQTITPKQTTKPPAQTITPKPTLKPPAQTITPKPILKPPAQTITPKPTPKPPAQTTISPKPTTKAPAQKITLKPTTNAPVQTITPKPTPKPPAQTTISSKPTTNAPAQTITPKPTPKPPAQKTISPKPTTNAPAQTITPKPTPKPPAQTITPKPTTKAPGQTITSKPTTKAPAQTITPKPTTKAPAQTTISSKPTTKAPAQKKSLKPTTKAPAQNITPKPTTKAPAQITIAPKPTTKARAQTAITPKLSTLVTTMTADNHLSRRRRRDSYTGITASKRIGYLSENGSCICTSTVQEITSPIQDVGKEVSTVITTPIQKKYSTVIPSLENSKVELNFEIEVGNANTTFNEKLNNRNSDTFKNLSETFKKQLYVVFNGTPGLSDIEVYGFRKGSIIAQYRIILKSFIDVKNATQHISTTVIKTITTTLTTIGNFQVNQDFFKSSIRQEIVRINATGCKAFSQDICPVGYICRTVGGNHSCTDLCIEDDKPVCGEHGKCYIDLKTYTAKCSCSEINGYIYHGVHCDSTAEDLKLDSIYIIAIASGCGGALLLIAVVAIICLVRMRRKNRRTPIDDKGKDFKSLSMDDFRLDRHNDSRSSNGYLNRPRKHTVENDYNTGLPGQDVKYVQGREHRVYKDEKGDETYFYQPTSHRSSVGSEYSMGSQRPNVYDYIDTDSRFEIQRPNIRLGHLNKF